MVIIVDDIHKVDEEVINKAVNVGEMVMHVEEQCDQSRRLSFKMTWPNFMLFKAIPRLRHHMYYFCP